jgi:carbonic anhydrase
VLLTWRVWVQYYRGSLTIPDCDERVTWLVLSHTMTALPEQIQEFTKIYPHINRYRTRTAAHAQL